MKKINWRNLSLLVIDFVLISHIVVTITSALRGTFIGLDGLVMAMACAIIAEPTTEEIIRLLNK